MLLAEARAEVGVKPQHKGMALLRAGARLQIQSTHNCPISSLPEPPPCNICILIHYWFVSRNVSNAVLEAALAIS